ncbi:hypothetical protein ACJHWP_24835, partial [Escherichia sp. WS288]|uniref:hypothetical protein n=1 Tax=Escherichia sp. WS288 TaxID=3381970 RepID=UPI00396F47DE
AITSGGRAADWKTGSFGPYGCPENLSVRFFPNSAGSPKSVSVSDRRAGEKSGVSGNTGIVPEMDDAVEGLGYGNKPLYYRIQ